MARFRALPAALVSLALLAFSPTAAPAQGAPPRPPVAPGEAGRIITVTGHGSVDATPDEATITLGVQTIRPTAQEAQDQSAAAMDRIVRQIAALGVPRERLRTAAVNLVPVRKPGASSAEVTGYEAVMRLVVTLDDLRLVGRVIDTAVAAGANAVYSLSFGLRDSSAYRARALRMAVQDARATAAAIAGAAGVSTLRLVRIDEIGPVAIARVGVAAPMAAPGGTPVVPGTLPVSVQIRAVYAF